MKTLKLILAGLLLCTMSAFADVQINEENFPDENFRNWILEQSYGSDGVITNAEIDTIITINVSQHNIFDLAGIKFFTNLRELDCSWNQLTSLDISGLANLNFVLCRFNQLTSLNVSDLTNLENLDCSSNQLTSLDVLDLINLEDLVCHNNYLTSLDLTKLNRLSMFNGSNQTPTLILTGANDNYSHTINLNNPTNLTDGLSYTNGILTSANNTITTSPFAVETGKPGLSLSGTLNLNYTPK